MSAAFTEQEEEELEEQLEEEQGGGDNDDDEQENEDIFYSVNQSAILTESNVVRTGDESNVVCDECGSDCNNEDSQCTDRSSTSQSQKRNQKLRGEKKDIGRMTLRGEGDGEEVRPRESEEREREDWQRFQQCSSAMIIFAYTVVHVGILSVDLAGLDVWKNC